MGQDLQTSAESIRRATRNSLLRANDLKIGSVAFPALGTGVGGFPMSQAAQIMVEEVVAHLRSPHLPARRDIRGHEFGGRTDIQRDAIRNLPSMSYTVGSSLSAFGEETSRRAHALVAERSAERENVIPAIASTHWWRGQVEPETKFSSR